MTGNGPVDTGKITDSFETLFKISLKAQNIKTIS